MPVDVGRKLENAPLPQMIQKLGVAIAEAQLAMDRFSIQVLKLMAQSGENGVKLPSRQQAYSMLELGFTPNFYHFTETTIEARVAFSMVEETEFELTVGAEASYAGIFTASVEASYTQKYSFHAEGSSMVRTRIVAVPPPSVVGDIIDGIRRDGIRRDGIRRRTSESPTG